MYSKPRRKFVNKLTDTQRYHINVSAVTDIPALDKYRNFYYTELSDALNITIEDLVKLPFRTARSFYFRLTRKFVYLPEGKYEKAVCDLATFIQTKILNKSEKSEVDLIIEKYTKNG